MEKYKTLRSASNLPTTTTKKKLAQTVIIRLRLESRHELNYLLGHNKTLVLLQNPISRANSLFVKTKWSGCQGIYFFRDIRLKNETGKIKGLLLLSVGYLGGI